MIDRNMQTDCILAKVSNEELTSLEYESPCGKEPFFCQTKRDTCLSNETVHVTLRRKGPFAVMWQGSLDIVFERKAQ